MNSRGLPIDIPLFPYTFELSLELLDFRLDFGDAFCISLEKASFRVKGQMPMVERVAGDAEKLRNFVRTVSRTHQLEGVLLDLSGVSTHPDLLGSRKTRELRIPA